MRRRVPVKPQAKDAKEDEKTSASVEKILREVWFDPEDGLGSAKDTLKQAQKRDASITMADVKKFFEKQESLQRKQGKSSIRTWPTSPVNNCR